MHHGSLVYNLDRWVTHCFWNNSESFFLATIQDPPRNFPSHPWLDTQEGHESPRRVLVGYSFHDSQVGFFQVRLVSNISSNFIFRLQLCYARFRYNWKSIVSCALIMNLLCILAAIYVDQVKIIVHKTWLKLCGCVVIDCH